MDNWARPRGADLKLNLERTQGEKDRYRLMQSVKNVLEAQAKELNEIVPKRDSDMVDVEGEAARLASGDERGTLLERCEEIVIDPEWNTFKLYARKGKQIRVLLAHVQGAYHFQPSDKKLQSLFKKSGDWLREEVDELQRL